VDDGVPEGSEVRFEALADTGRSLVRDETEVDGEPRLRGHRVLGFFAHGARLQAAHVQGGKQNAFLDA
jgi:hypothetical protein